MIVYTADQIFDILGSITCQSDLIEIEHYIISNRAAYAWFDLILFQECIENLYSVIK